MEILQRIFLFALLTTLVTQAGVEILSWHFASLFGLTLVIEYFARREGYATGVADGVAVYHQMSPEEKHDIDQILKEIE